MQTTFTATVTVDHDESMDPDDAIRDYIDSTDIAPAFELAREPVTMIGVTVLRVDEPADQLGVSVHGYVAHALLSDGTKSWPMGARAYDTSGGAEREALMIRWRNGGPQIERNPED